MKRFVAPLLFVFLLAGLVWPVAASAQKQSKVEFMNYWIVLVSHGPNWKSQNTEEGVETKMKVMENLGAAITEGEIIIAGLVIDDIAADFVLIVEAEDEQKLRRMIKDAPTVRSGFYDTKILSWFAPKGLSLKEVPLKKTN